MFRPEIEVNTYALANFTFLTQETNLLVSNRDPAEYLEEFGTKHADVIESHWIPTDRRLWRIEDYREFLDVRRELLAEAANAFLDGLLAGAVPEPEAISPIVEREVATMPGGLAVAEEEDLLMTINEWVVEQGLPEGEFLYELADPHSGDAVALFDLAWPDGLQEGLSEPVALLIDEPAEIHNAANRAGFRFFTDVETFRAYVRQEILASEGEEERSAA